MFIEIATESKDFDILKSLIEKTLEQGKIPCVRVISKPPVERLFAVMEQVLGVTREQLCEQNRHGDLGIYRQVFCYVAVKHIGIHPVRVAELVNRKRATVINAVRSVNDLSYKKVFVNAVFDEFLKNNISYEKTN